MAVTVTATFEETAGRVRLDVAGLTTAAQTVTITRQSLRPHASGTAAVVWESSDVRGWSGTAYDATDAMSVWDYEYDPSDDSTYWYTTYRVVTSLGGDVSATIRPVQTEWWIKSIQNPRNNRRCRSRVSPDFASAAGTTTTSGILVTALSALKRTARRGVFPILGSTRPVVVTDVHTSREFDVSLWCDTATDAADLEDLVTVGDTLFLQAPAQVAAPGPLWCVAGDWTVDQPIQGAQRAASFSVIEVEPPDPSITGVAWTYQTTKDTYASYAALKAAFDDYAELKVGPAPGEVTV